VLAQDKGWGSGGPAAHMHLERIEAIDQVSLGENRSVTVVAVDRS
jgi:flagellar biogenesis protein FliO